MGSINNIYVETFTPGHWTWNISPIKIILGRIGRAATGALAQAHIQIYDLQESENSEGIARFATGAPAYVTDSKGKVRRPPKK